MFCRILHANLIVCKITKFLNNNILLSGKYMEYLPESYKEEVTPRFGIPFCSQIIPLEKLE